MNFNPRPRKEGDKKTYRDKIYRRHFNPRPRKEGDFFDGDKEEKIAISIHALVKRTTER